MKPLAIGTMRKRLVLEKNLPQQKDGFQQPQDNWVAQATVYAAVEPITGREFFSGAQVQADVSHKITIRYRPDLTPTAAWRGRMGTRLFHFASVRDVEERHVAWEIMATEAPPQG